MHVLVLLSLIGCLRVHTLIYSAPREKINVLIVGNHSAGKSSFINWYVKDNIQKESMAMETSGFTFVTSGMTLWLLIRTLANSSNMYSYTQIPFDPLSPSLSLIHVHMQQKQTTPAYT